jgi:hypothetical protein
MRCGFCSNNFFDNVEGRYSCFFDKIDKDNECPDFKELQLFPKIEIHQHVFARDSDLERHCIECGQKQQKLIEVHWIDIPA